MAHADQLWREAQRPDIPAGERYDINGELFNEFVTGLNFPDQEQVVVGLPALYKASTLEPFYEQHLVGRRKSERHTSIIYLNEYGLVDHGEGHSRYYEKRSMGGFQFLRDTVNAVDLIQAIIRTRVRQVMSFLIPERDEGPLGFRIARTDGEELSENEVKEAARIEGFVMNSGTELDPCERDRLRRSDLEGFVTKLLWDSLTADACPVELVRTNGNKLVGYHNLDFNTIRLCGEHGYEGRDEIRAIQLIDYTPAVAFSYHDLLYEVRTPRTDLNSGGYGFAESEGVVRALTGYINAVTYNSSGIDRSAVPRGILTLYGEFDQPQLHSFQRTLKAMLSGAGNRHNIPVLVSRDSKTAGHNWTPIDQFSEMFFARWLTFLVSICCAEFGIAPDEIHFDSFSTRTSALGGKADTEEKLAQGHDKGLVPTVRFVEKVMTRIVQLINPKFRWQAVGLHPEDENQKHERIKLSSTWNELRKIDGRDPIDDDLLGNAPAGNPALIQVYMQTPEVAQIIAQNQQMQQEAMGGGQPGEPGQGGAQGPEGAQGGPQGAGEEYPQDVRGKHAPYGFNPDGGEPYPPEEGEHMHSLDFGKAVPPARKVTRRSSLLIVQPDA